MRGTRSSVVDVQDGPSWMRAMKPYHPPAGASEPRRAAKRMILPEVGYRPDQAALEELLFAVRPLEGAQFKYEGNQQRLRVALATAAV